jgi:hypothetical protein
VGNPISAPASISKRACATILAWSLPHQRVVPASQAGEDNEHTRITIAEAYHDERNSSRERPASPFETTAEVLGGLRKAYDDFEKKNEGAWR